MNPDEKKQQAWESFTSSGKVEDYLIYNSLKGEAYVDDKNKGDSGGGNSPWGTR